MEGKNGCTTFLTYTLAWSLQLRIYEVVYTMGLCEVFMNVFKGSRERLCPLIICWSGSMRGWDIGLKAGVRGVWELSAN